MYGKTISKETTPVEADQRDAGIRNDTTFAKKCQNTASAEYAQLQSVRRDYPTFAVTTRKIKSNPNKETYAGLTYEYMRNYIITHASDETREKEVAEFDELILISKCQTKAKRYPTIKKWFLVKYPAIAKFVPVVV